MLPKRIFQLQSKITTNNVAGSIAALQEWARINDTYAQGFETHLMIPFPDNADPQNPAFFEFYIPQDMVNINEAILRIQLLWFRAYSRAVRGGGGTTVSTTDGGGGAPAGNGANLIITGGLLGIPTGQWIGTMDWRRSRQHQPRYSKHNRR